MAKESSQITFLNRLDLDTIEKGLGAARGISRSARL